MCAGYRALVCVSSACGHCQMDEAKRPALPERRNTETGFPSLGSPSSSTATCAGCAKAVIGECLHALGKSWHPACFKCQGCSISYVHRRTVLGRCRATIGGHGGGVSVCYVAACAKAGTNKIPSLLKCSAALRQKGSCVRSVRVRRYVILASPVALRAGDRSQRSLLKARERVRGIPRACVCFIGVWALSDGRGKTTSAA